MIFRDDDIGYMTNIEEFKKVHKLFNEYNQTHTIAILTKDLEKNVELVEYIKSQSNINYQVHSYEHIDFVFANDAEVYEQLSRSIAIIKELFNIQPTVFYPPFNSVNERVIKIAAKLGLETSYEKVGAVYYIKHNGDVIQTTLNFHYHDYIESILIGPCLKIYNERSKK